jgi:hypothetical protein
MNVYKMMNHGIRRAGSVPVAVIVIYLAIFPSNAHAYIDPGAGSVLLQGFLGLVAATSAITIAYWRNVKAFLARFAKPKRHNG